MNEIMTAVNGRFNAHQRMILKMLLKYLEQMEKHLAEVETEIETEIQKIEHAIELLDSIPSIDQIASSSIIAEIGIDMKQFKTSEHICSWARLSPGNNESAGKKKRAKSNRGNPYIKSMLCEVTWVIGLCTCPLGIGR